MPVRLNDIERRQTRTKQVFLCITTVSKSSDKLQKRPNTGRCCIYGAMVSTFIGFLANIVI